MYQSSCYYHKYAWYWKNNGILQNSTFLHFFHKKKFLGTPCTKWGGVTKLHLLFFWSQDCKLTVWRKKIHSLSNLYGPNSAPRLTLVLRPLKWRHAKICLCREIVVFVEFLGWFIVIDLYTTVFVNIVWSLWTCNLPFLYSNCYFFNICFVLSLNGNLAQSPSWKLLSSQDPRGLHTALPSAGFHLATNLFCILHNLGSSGECARLPLGLFRKCRVQSHWFWACWDGHAFCCALFSI